MRVERIALENFRNYEREAVEFERGLNLVRGENAQGKTNLLEAVHVLSGLGSPRGDAAAIVRTGCTSALIHATVERSGRSIDVDMELKPGRGLRVLVNKTPVQRLKALADLVVTVFFGPDELSLVKGSPDGRRRFLDELLVKLHPAREGLRKDLDRVVRQRSALLRAIRNDEASVSELDVWDASLGRAGAALASARLSALAELVPYARKRYVEIAGGGSFELSYSASWLSKDRAMELLSDPSAIDGAELEAGLLARMAQLRRAELERAVTLVGPQRDDVVVTLSPRNAPAGLVLDARTHASQGDQRTCALALKLAEHDLLSERLRESPILLLDDVFSELDAHRREWLMDAVRDRGQTIVSTAEPVAFESLRPDTSFEIRAGRVVGRG